MPIANGKPRKKSGDVKQRITDYYDKPGYSWSLQGWINWRDTPPFIRFLHIPSMQTDPRLKLCMEILKGMATSLSRFYIDEGKADSENPSDIKEFAIKQITRFWASGAYHMLDAMDWGWCGAETLYRYREDGMLAFRGFQKFRAQDVYPVTLDGEICGIMLEMLGRRYLGGQHAFWHVHRRDFHRFWGRSRYESSYVSWFELYDRQGAFQTRRHYFYRHSFQGEIGRYPEGSRTDEKTGQTVENREIMRSLVENARSGGVYILPSDRDAASGELEWDIVDRNTGNTSHDVRDYVTDLKDEMTEGMGVSKELFQAADTGSGYSGRKIPEQAVRGILTQVVYWLISDFNEQVLKPLIRRNFGCDPDYEIIPFGLIEEDQPVEGEGTGSVPGSAVDKARANEKVSREAGNKGSKPMAV